MCDWGKTPSDDSFARFTKNVILPRKSNTDFKVICRLLEFLYVFRFALFHTRQSLTYLYWGTEGEKISHIVYTASLVPGRISFV